MSKKVHRSRYSLDRRAWLAAALAMTSGTLSACKTKSALAEQLPRLGNVGNFDLVNQDNQRVTADTLKGDVWVAAFFFTRCPTVCPRIMKRMSRIQQTVKERRLDLELVSLSVDPEFDRPAVLKEFAKQYGADFARWSFLTGDSATIQKTVEQGFKVGLSGAIDESKEHLGISHGSHLVLVDHALEIRGYYRTSDEERMRELLLHSDWLSRAKG
jgi:protein SCO1/2